MTPQKQSMLPPFEGHQVARAQVRIARAGDGLSAALEVEPKALELGDEVAYILRGTVTQVNHREKDGVTTRLHTVDAEEITEVDGLVAERMLREAAQELEKKKQAQDGQEPLFRDDDAGFQGRSGVHPDRPADDPTDEEQAALAAEHLDETGTPTEVAHAARARVEGNVITPSFSNPPAAGE